MSLCRCHTTNPLSDACHRLISDILHSTSSMNEWWVVLAMNHSFPHCYGSPSAKDLLGEYEYSVLTVLITFTSVVSGPM